MTSLISVVITDGLGDLSSISLLPCRRSCLDSTTYAGRLIIEAAVPIAGDTDRRDSPASLDLARLVPLGRKETGLTGIRADGAVAVTSSLSWLTLSSCDSSTLCLEVTFPPVLLGHCLVPPGGLLRHQTPDQNHIAMAAEPLLVSQVKVLPLPQSSVARLRLNGEVRTHIVGIVGK